MEQPLDTNMPETTWAYDMSQAIRRKDWSKLGSLVLIEAGLPVLKLAGLFGGILLVAWIVVFVEDHVPREDLKFLIVAIPVGLALLAFGLWAAFWLGLAAIQFWQMSIIFILIGGFIGHGPGALIGAALSGGIGLILIKVSDRQ